MSCGSSASSSRLPPKLSGERLPLTGRTKSPESTRFFTPSVAPRSIRCVTSAPVTVTTYAHSARAGPPRTESGTKNETFGPPTRILVGKKTRRFTSAATDCRRESRASSSSRGLEALRRSFAASNQIRLSASSASCGTGVRQTARSQANAGATSARRPGSMAVSPRPFSRSVSM
jgi:hypothetical protein